MTESRPMSKVRDVAIVGLLAWLVWNTSTRTEPSTGGLVGAEPTREAVQASPVLAELQAAVTELRGAARALAQSAERTDRTRVEPTPSSAPGREVQDAAPILTRRESGYADLKAMAGRVLPKQESAVAKLMARVQEHRAEAVTELLFVPLARVVEMFGRPDYITPAQDGSLSIGYKVAEGDTIEMKFFDGLLIHLIGG